MRSIQRTSHTGRLGRLSISLAISVWDLQALDTVDILLAHRPFTIGHEQHISILSNGVLTPEIPVDDTMQVTDCRHAWAGRDVKSVSRDVVLGWPNGSYLSVAHWSVLIGATLRRSKLSRTLLCSYTTAGWRTPER